MPRNRTLDALIVTGSLVILGVALYWYRQSSRAFEGLMTEAQKQELQGREQELQNQAAKDRTLWELWLAQCGRRDDGTLPDGGTVCKYPPSPISDRRETKIKKEGYHGM